MPPRTTPTAKRSLKPAQPAPGSDQSLSQQIPPLATAMSSSFQSPTIPTGAASSASSTSPSNPRKRRASGQMLGPVFPRAPSYPPASSQPQAPSFPQSPSFPPSPSYTTAPSYSAAPLPPMRRGRGSSPIAAPGHLSPIAPPAHFGEVAPVTQQGTDEAAADVAAPRPAKKARTNTPWTADEEHRLKGMRDQGKSWGEIAKTFPNRTEGSVKKHWYKDMHYAEFNNEESAALLAAIKEYEANKWKFIGQKLGKPSKACEQYAKQNFTKS